MAKFQIGKGLSDYIALLGNLEFNASNMIGRSIYVGAAVVADEIRSQIEALPVGEIERGNKQRYPTQIEKDGLLAGLGIAKMQNDSGYYNVKIGMDGYNDHVTAKYPKGHPNAMVARSIDSGSTYMKKVPFISRSVQATKAKAEEEMKKQFDELAEEVVNKHGG